MHEFTIISNLIKQAGEVCRLNGATFVTEIRIELGPLSGVEPLLLSSALDQWQRISLDAEKHTSKHPFFETKLVIDQVPLTARCDSCNTHFEIRDFRFLCPDCQGNITVTGGDELILVSVSVSNDEATANSVRSDPPEPMELNQ